MILSGGSDGLIAVSSRTTGMTVRVINDQQGAPLTGIDVQPSPVRTAVCSSCSSCNHIRLNADIIEDVRGGKHASGRILRKF